MSDARRLAEGDRAAWIVAMIHNCHAPKRQKKWTKFNLYRNRPDKLTKISARQLGEMLQHGNKRER